MSESEEELKSLLMKLKERERAGLEVNIQKANIMASGLITSWQIDGETMETVTSFIFLGSKITSDSDYRHEIKRYFLFGRKDMTNLDNILKSRNITLPIKVYIVKAMVFLVVMYRCGSWTIKVAECRKNWYFWTVMLEKTLESPLDCSEIKPVHPKGNQSWIFIGSTDAEAEAPVVWPPDVRSQLIGKDPDAGKERRQEETGMPEHEMVWWHYWLSGHEFGQAPRDGEGQGNLACCSP